ncbi:hypothetical protein [Thermithiobacillus plumbiphilus]|uniref:Uncharacterized protein n=1 Tax=Thermithiobacillus plumbiphilus TaxID=1729899 RepID=A0ABU9DB70_9PROT
MNKHGHSGTNVAEDGEDREMNMGVNDIPGPADGMAANSMPSRHSPGRSTLSKPIILWVGVVLLILALIAGYSL